MAEFGEGAEAAAGPISKPKVVSIKAVTQDSARNVVSKTETSGKPKSAKADTGAVVGAIAELTDQLKTLSYRR